jgi:hypothetical protein
MVAPGETGTVLGRSVSKSGKAAFPPPLAERGSVCGRAMPEREGRTGSTSACLGAVLTAASLFPTGRSAPAFDETAGVPFPGGANRVAGKTEGGFPDPPSGLDDTGGKELERVLETSGAFSGPFAPP